MKYWVFFGILLDTVQLEEGIFCRVSDVGRVVVACCVGAGVGQMSLPPTCGHLSAPQPVLVKVGETVDQDGHGQGDGEHPEQGAKSSDQLSGRRHWCHRACEYKSGHSYSKLALLFWPARA